MIERKLLRGSTARLVSASVTCLASLALPAQAQAQTAESGDGEIIVTAQRREEKLRDVPIAITALGGATLERAGISSAHDLGLVTPGLNFAVQGAFGQPTIRGIGTSLAARARTPMSRPT